MNLSIRTRVVLAQVLVLTALLVAVGCFVVAFLSHDLTVQSDQSLLSRAGQLRANYAREGDEEFIENAAAVTSGVPTGQSWVQLLDPAGVLLKTTDGGLAARTAIGRADVAAALSDGTHLTTLTLGPDRQRFRVVLAPVGNAAHLRVLVLAASLAVTENVVTEVTRATVITGVLAVVVAAGCGWWLTRLALLPLTRISRQAERIHVNNLDERVRVGNVTDEVGHLAGTLNAMFGRLRAGVYEHRRLLADTSHELRTPLAIMRAELDAALSAREPAAHAVPTLERNAVEVDRMSRMVANLLTLSRIDQGDLELFRRPVDLFEEADVVADRFRQLAADKGIRLTVTGEPTMVDADRDRIHQVLTNLVDNAVKYTAAGSVAIQVERNAGEARVSVSDTGPGIPPDRTGAVFDRFYRLDSARSRSTGGSGLGLAICLEIVQVHGGRIWVESEPGHGSRFTFTLPDRR